jgi:hypothetical protein
MKFPRVLTVGALTAAIAAGTISTAAASATAYESKYQYLTSSPTASDATSCVSRSTYLAKGTYTWELRLEGAPKSRSIALAAGTYYWETCMIPKAGYYYMESYLKLSGYQAATLATDIGTDSSGKALWGSSLSS